MHLSKYNLIGSSNVWISKKISFEYDLIVAREKFIDEANVTNVSLLSENHNFDSYSKI